jgi:hypothetical protein
MARRWAVAAATAAAALAAIIILGACGSTAPPAVTPGSHVVTPPRWGVQFTVSDWLSWDSIPPGLEGVLLFHTPEGDRGGGEIVVARLRLPAGNGVSRSIQFLNDLDAVRRVLPGGVGAGADVTVVHEATRTEVGPGWPAAEAAYRVSLADGKEPLFGQRTFGMQMAVFSHVGYLYFVSLLVSPDGVAGPYRAVFQLTVRSFNDAQ